MREFQLRTTILAPVAACFDLSLSVDAHRESMGESGERAIAGVTSGPMALGDMVTWRARHLGVTFTMTSAITAYERSSRFVDEQASGPFKVWWHEHTFEAVPGDGTLMTDRVRFQAPLRPIGTLAEDLVLNRYMPHLLARRNRWLKATLESR